MQSYVGLDVSLRQTAVCVVDQTGKIMREGMIDSDPDVICNFIRTAAPNLARIGLETGATSTWLWTELKKRGQPVICIDARHAKAALKMQINKSDRNDAAGIARIMQAGWYKEVRVKDLDSHAVRALLASRALLVELKRDLENQIRGLLKNFGLVIGRSKMNTFTTRATVLIDGRPELAAAIEPLLKARDALAGQIDGLDRKVLRLARSEPQVRRFMTVPGVGPITALCYLATIDDPARFKKSQRGRLCGPDDQTLRVRRDRSDRPHIQMRRWDVEKLSVRSCQRAAHARYQMVGTHSLGHAHCQAQKHEQGARSSRAQAGCHPASDVDRRHRILLVKGREQHATKPIPA